MTTTAAATNSQVGEKIGMSHSGVSRIRSGDRLPSFEKMDEIAIALDWPIDQQIAARRAGSYAAKFEEHVADKFGAATRDLPITPAS